MAVVELVPNRLVKFRVLRPTGCDRSRHVTRQPAGFFRRHRVPHPQRGTGMFRQPNVADPQAARDLRTIRQNMPPLGGVKCHNQICADAQTGIVPQYAATVRAHPRRHIEAHDKRAARAPVIQGIAL